MKTFIATALFVLFASCSAHADTLHFPEVAGAVNYILQQASTPCGWQVRGSFKGADICSNGTCAVTVTLVPSAVNSFSIAASGPDGINIAEYFTAKGAPGAPVILTIPYQ